MSVISNSDDYLCIDKELGITLVRVDPELAENEWKNKQYKEILDDIEALKSIMQEFGEYVSIQQEDIDRIEKSVFDSSSSVENAVADIQVVETQTQENRKSYFYYATYIPVAVSVTASVAAVVVLKVLSR